MVLSERQQNRNRHLAALDLVEAWMQDEDADVSNIADRLAQQPKAACYTMARLVDAAVQLWADAASLDRHEAFAALRAKIELDLAR